MDELQNEIEAINAIYPGSMSLVDGLQFRLFLPEHNGWRVVIEFDEQYPNTIPQIKDIFNINERKFVDSKYLVKHAQEIVEKMFIPGEVCCYELIMELDEFFTQYEEERGKHEKAQTPETHGEEEIEHRETYTARGMSHKGVSNFNNDENQDVLADWILSEPIVDRGSRFIAFAKAVHSVDEAQEAVSALVSTRKISKATHNITCWRIQNENGVRYQDCDDDGEAAAGSKVLHLMTLTDSWNVVVVVSRWFGGVHLGPDRFKHISSAARDVIIKGNFSSKVRKTQEKPTSGKNKKNKK